MTGGEATSGDRRTVSGSPSFRAMWADDVPVELFESAPLTVSQHSAAVMRRSLAVARGHVGAGTVYDEESVVAADVVAGLAEAGYWGLRADVRYGGSGCSLAGWAPFVAEMTAVEPWIAAMASPHAALGPVNLISAYGSDEQQARLLPPLADGRRLGAFAVTEPGTASDWGALRTTAVRSGEALLLSGEKLFITNALPGRTAAVLCWIDGRLRMLIVELPAVEDGRFQAVGYRLRAPSHLAKRGLVFHELPVPADNVLEGDGRAVAYHGLNHGRVLVCSFAAGLLRLMAGALAPWVQVRSTFGAPIGDRELVRRRLGRLAARIVGCDAVLAWAAQLIDRGYRGESECVTAKVFASEAVSQAAVDLLSKTHGSRAFLPGSLFADVIYDMLALTVIEGENEIISLGSLASLAKARLSTRVKAPAVPRRHRAGTMDLEELTAEAAAGLRECGNDLDAALRQHGPALVARQAAAAELAERIQQATVTLVVTRYGARHHDPLVRQAASLMAAELRQRLTGTRPTDGYLRRLTELGAAVAEDSFPPTAAVSHGPVAMPDHVPHLIPAP